MSPVDKLQLLSEFLAGAALDPGLLRLLGPATSHAGLRNQYGRHRAREEARYDSGDAPRGDADDEFLPEDAGDVEGVPFMQRATPDRPLVRCCR
jgi:hypothetical protein